VSVPGFSVAKTYALQEDLVYDGRMITESKVQFKCKNWTEKSFTLTVLLLLYRALIS